ncbi:putative sulfatase [Pullulanibacillus camelliae]|uniref:Putative sulfatase n=1 Tax=Pullulanibacillus camelliae TaxID=1707096 RepID=A0A8J2VL51_9BACL|nr:sulfatase [Pullulanibacillus camelliae]GGE27663.1 putative sulfatase [Pullulanibacillus camelliae]
MNVIYMHTHDTGKWIEPYGQNARTPNLMKLAKEGTIFRKAFCAAPTCSPSRAALLTGMTPHSSGMLGLAHRGFQLNNYDQHLVQYLNSNGYETVLCGIQHEAEAVESLGYRRILDNQNYDMGDFDKDWTEFDKGNAQQVASFLNESHEEPFFLSFGMFNTHREFPQVDSDIDLNYVAAPYQLHDNKENRLEMARFLSSVRVVDDCVGIVMNAIKESGHEKDTLIIFTTDHGPAFPFMKCNLYDEGIGVSLIIRHPDADQAPKAFDGLISHIDLFPTLCDLLNLEHPDWLQGVSFSSIFKGNPEKVREELFSEVTYHAAYEPSRSIRTERYKYIRYFDDDLNIAGANIDDSHSKTFLIENGFLNMHREREQLFDLYLDPMERTNLVNDRAYHQVFMQMSQRLHEWMVKTNDPLLSGQVLKPEGAIVNRRSAISPNSDDFE